MKRKVKFQEGGAVGESPRNRKLRETMEKFGREGKRTGLAERARERQRAERRAASQRDVERLNPGQGGAESERRAGRAVPERRPDFTTGPDGTTRRGAATGREMVPRREPSVPARQGGREMVPFREPGMPAAQGGREAMPRPSASRALAEVATPRQMPLGRVRPPVGGNLATIVGGTAAAAAEPMVDYGRRFMERRGAEADARREANLQAFRNREVAPPSDGPAAGSMQNAPRPAPRPTARPAPAQAPRPRVREMTADELNEMELRRIRAERQMEEDDARERRRAAAMREPEQEGGSGNIGAASARERGEQVGPPGDYNNFRKGGMVKPKKMMKGGVVAKPKAATKAKAKPMPAFKKGGMIKKGKK